MLIAQSVRDECNKPVSQCADYDPPGITVSVAVWRTPKTHPSIVTVVFAATPLVRTWNAAVAAPAGTATVDANGAARAGLLLDRLTGGELSLADDRAALKGERGALVEPM
jgi:hypothetical protein